MTVAVQYKKKKVKIPEPEVGDIVNWWHLGLTSNTPLPAIVTHNGGQGNLSIHVFRRTDTLILGGVKHRDDPSLNKIQKDRTGCWGMRD